MKRKRKSALRSMLGRDLWLFLRGVPMALLLAGVLGVLAWMAAAGLHHGTDSGYTVAPVAVVDEDGSLTSTLAVSLLSKQDFASPLQIVKTREDRALAGLADGSVSAVLYLPKGYAGDILSGQRTEARLIVSENAPLHADVLSLLCSFGEELLSTGQYGIFAGEELVWQLDSGRHSAYLKAANARFLGQAMGGTGTVRQQVSYGMTGVSPESWYLLMYAVCFFRLMCLGCPFCVRDRSSAMLRRLSAAGVSDAAFFGSKLLILFVFYGLMAGALVFWRALPITIQTAGSLAAAVLSLAAGGLALIWCLGSRAVAVVTALTAAELLGGGGIIPRMELPRLVTRVADLLPMGAAARASGVLLGGGFDPVSVGVCLGWALVGWLALRLSMARLRKGAER